MPARRLSDAAAHAPHPLSNGSTISPTQLYLDLVISSAHLRASLYFCISACSSTARAHSRVSASHLTSCDPRLFPNRALAS